MQLAMIMIMIVFRVEAEKPIHPIHPPYALCCYPLIGRAPHWLKSVTVSYIACMDCENDKI